MTTSIGFGELRLAAAERHFSGMAVTAFLTEVEIVACSAVGVEMVCVRYFRYALK